jgi:hypothetical protein
MFLNEPRALFEEAGLDSSWKGLKETLLFAALML